MQKTKYIKKILMCKPTHFRVEYSINPWMKGEHVDTFKALKQWEDLVEKLSSQGIKVEIIEQDENLPDMVFCADQGIVIGKNVLMSNFRYPERQKERTPFKNWFTNNNFTTKFIEEKNYFEGTGECLFFGDKLLMGEGFRSSVNSAKEIADVLDIEVIPIELISPDFYHLDTCLMPLNNKTVFYYPPAISKKSINILEKLVPDLRELSKEEVYSFAANSLVTDHHVVVQKGNDSFMQKLRDLSYTIIEADISEFIKAGGGIHCLTEVLEEEYA